MLSSHVKPRRHHLQQQLATAPPTLLFLKSIPSGGPKHAPLYTLLHAIALFPSLLVLSVALFVLRPPLPVSLKPH
jgi:hypothetical protein